jgi:hypothetical protein
MITTLVSLKDLKPRDIVFDHEDQFWIVVKNKLPREYYSHTIVVLYQDGSTSEHSYIAEKISCRKIIKNIVATNFKSEIL